MLIKLLEKTKTAVPMANLLGTQFQPQELEIQPRHKLDHIQIIPFIED